MGLSFRNELVPLQLMLPLRPAAFLNQVVRVRNDWPFVQRRQFIARNASPIFDERDSICHVQRFDERENVELAATLLDYVGGRGNCFINVELESHHFVFISAYTRRIPKSTL